MSKISELSDGGSLVSSDYLIAVRSGGNVKVRMDQINVDQVDLGDNEFIRLGNSQDLTMVHNATNSIINQAGIGDLLIQKAGATKLTINASGIDVTGGVTADGLTVDGNPVINGTSPQLFLQTGASNTNWQIAAQENVSNAFEISSGAADASAPDDTYTPRLVILNTGSVGIGTSTPSSALDVVGSVTASNALVITGGITGHGANRATFSQEGANGAFIQSYGANASTMGAFSFRQASSDFSITATPLTISATGNVGIGTSSITSFAGYTSLEINNATSGALLDLSQGDSMRGRLIATATTMSVETSGSIPIIFQPAGSEAMRIDASGRVGIGGVPNTNWRNDLANQEVLMLGTEATLFSDGGVTTELWNNAYIDNTDVIFNISTRAASRYQQYQGAHKWWTAASVSAGSNINTELGTTPKMTLDVSGNLLVGRTSSGNTGNGHTIRGGDSAIFSRDASGETMQICRNASAGDLVRFICNGVDKGSIDFDGNNTISYTSSSDQRLKENIADADDAGSKIDAIQVRKFDWKADGSHQDYGMVAQELQVVAPEAVSAPEDPEEMMGVDYSKLVPMLVKEIQSLRARVAQLES